MAHTQLESLGSTVSVLNRDAEEELGDDISSRSSHNVDIAAGNAIVYCYSQKECVTVSNALVKKGTYIHTYISIIIYRYMYV